MITPNHVPISVEHEMLLAPGVLHAAPRDPGSSRHLGNRRLLGWVALLCRRVQTTVETYNVGDSAEFLHAEVCMHPLRAQTEVTEREIWMDGEWAVVLKKDHKHSWEPDPWNELFHCETSGNK